MLMLYNVEVWSHCGATQEYRIKDYFTESVNLSTFKAGKFLHTFIAPWFSDVQMHK